ncbi:hypothetical protein Peur_023812 [Populus x canadensis]
MRERDIRRRLWAVASSSPVKELTQLRLFSNDHSLNLERNRRACEVAKLLPLPELLQPIACIKADYIAQVDKRTKSGKEIGIVVPIRFSVDDKRKQAKLHLVACGCSSSDSIDRDSVRNYAKSVSKSCNRDYGSRRMVCCRRDIARCRVSSTKTPETLLARVAEGPTVLLNLKKESREPVSFTNLFEVVAADL